MKHTILFVVILIAIGALAGAVGRKKTQEQGREYLPIALGSTDVFQVIRSGRWLVVFQNPHELRPTGGFWGTIGMLSWNDDGTPSITAGDVYEIDGPAEAFAQVLPLPPAPLLQYIGVKRWFLRDANWDPDFAVSAEQALDLYAKEARPNPLPDGVIALNAQLLDELLLFTGPVTVDGVTFSSGNALDTIIEEVEVAYKERGVPSFARKAILGKFVNQLRKKLAEKPMASIQWLISRLPDYRDRKLIQLYASDPKAQALFAAQGWAGGLSRGENQDVLFVVDANLAAYKTDAAVERSTRYTLLESEGNGVVTLELDYHHTKPQFDYRTTRYRSYTRVYVPNGSTLLDSTGTMADDRLKNPAGDPGRVDAGDNGQFTVYGFFFAVEPGERHTVTLRYKLPEALWRHVQATREYRLIVQHQSGVRRRPLTVSVNFGTPEGPITIQREGKSDEIIDVALSLSPI